MLNKLKRERETHIIALVYNNNYIRGTCIVPIMCSNDFVLKSSVKSALVLYVRIPVDDIILLYNGKKK